MSAALEHGGTPRALELTVRAVMTPDPLSVAPDTEFKTIVDVLSRRQISAVPVVDTSGRPVGVVSEADLLCKQQGTGRHGGRLFGMARGRQRKAAAVTARELMTSPVQTVDVDRTVAEAARLLARTGRRRLFVVDGGRLSGVLARRDLLDIYLRADGDIRDEIVREVFGLRFRARPDAYSVTVEHGTVTLLGQLERRSQVLAASGLVTAVPGVVQVRNRLDYVWNDSPDGVRG